jgi:hypothetical protein
VFQISLLPCHLLYASYVIKFSICHACLIRWFS